MTLLNKYQKVLRENRSLKMKLKEKLQTDLKEADYNKFVNKTNEKIKKINASIRRTESVFNKPMTTEEKQQVFINNRTENYRHSMKLEGL